MASILSTSDQRRETVVSSAIATFANTGYLGTPIAKVAEHAKISPAYVFKLFPSKESLFVAALERCFELIVQTLADGAEASADRTPEGILDAMGGAYAELISDRELLMMQVHAQSASDVEEVRRALRSGMGRVASFASSRSGASDIAVQRFMAYGQLCHMIVTTDLESVDADWARALVAGVRHPEGKEVKTS